MRQHIATQNAAELSQTAHALNPHYSRLTA
jgi:hypothetical protein